MINFNDELVDKTIVVFREYFLVLKPDKNLTPYCENKYLRNLKEAYNKFSNNSKQVGKLPAFLAYYTKFDKVLGCRDVLNIPKFQHLELIVKKLKQTVAMSRLRFTKKVKMEKF